MTNPLALAHYAHTRLEPLFARAKAVVPTIQFTIEATYADAESVHSKTSHLTVYSHWGRHGMFQQSGWLEDMPDVDRFAAKVADDVEQLEAGE